MGRVRRPANNSSALQAFAFAKILAIPSAKGPFPERSLIHGLVAGFLADFAATAGEWAKRSIGAVEQRPDDISKATPDLQALVRVAQLGYNRTYRR